MNRPTNTGMIAARRRRMCNEFAHALLLDVQWALTHPIRPPLNMGNYHYFADFQKVAATMISIIQFNNEQTH